VPWQPCYLDRQVISLLSTSGLGILDQAFLKLLNTSLLHLDGALKSSEGAALMVRDHAQKSTTSCMLSAGFNVARDSQLLELVLAIRNRLVLDLRMPVKARILVKGGVNHFGVLDQSGVLPSDTIYFSSTVSEAPPAGTQIIVGRNPCLHPGDRRR
jgi:hypothetical protein